MDKLNQLKLKKAQLEHVFEEKEKQVRVLANDIMLMEQLFAKKNELNKVVGEINGIKQDYDEVCKEIEAEQAKAKAEAAKKEEVKEEKIKDFKNGKNN